MALLAFETSCDETSAAVVHQGVVLSNIVSSQTRLHSEYGGVVPELAAREHLRNLMPVAREALGQAQMTAPGLEAIAATQGPGLPSALLVGFRAAQAMAFALRRPFLGLHHHEAHLYSAWISGIPPAADFSEFEPSVSLIVSGGHTMLVHVEAELDHHVLGSTVDDAAGECFDKAGKLMGCRIRPDPRSTGSPSRAIRALTTFPGRCSMTPTMTSVSAVLKLRCATSCAIILKCCRTRNLSGICAPVFRQRLSTCSSLKRYGLPGAWVWVASPLPAASRAIALSGSNWLRPAALPGSSSGWPKKAFARITPL